MRALHLVSAGMLVVVSGCFIEPLELTPPVVDAAPGDASVADVPVPDAPVADAATDASAADAATDAAAIDAAAIDAATIDAATIDAAAIDARPIDAAIDATPIDAPPPTPTVPLLRRPLNNTYTGNASRAGSRRPTFAWSTATGGTGAITYELQISTSPSFASGVTTQTTTATSLAQATDLAASATPPVGTRHYWRVRACDAVSMCSAYSMTWWINVGRVLHDFNGDGYGDVAAGAIESDAAGTNFGRAYVYFGGATSNTVADGVMDGIESSEAFGGAGAAADVNGDGYADLFVGAYWNDSVGSQAGRVAVYLGGPGTTLDATADAVFLAPATGAQFGISVSSAGDLNADGYEDVVIGAHGIGRAYIYLGGPGAVETTSDGELSYAGGLLFGLGVSGGGDFDGDGYADVAVSDWTSGAGTGRVHLFYGHSGTTFTATPQRTITSPAGTNEMGRHMATHCDFNGDGFSDVLAGAAREDTPAVDAGRAYVFFGSEGTFDITADGALTGAAANDLFGDSLACGDFNGDGYSDIVAGARHNAAAGSDAGRSYVYRGAAGATFEGTADATMNGSAAGDQFGFEAGSGDIDGDGLDDAIVSAYYNDAGGINAGRVYVYQGVTGTTFDTTVDRTFTGLAGESLGHFVE
ncbi:MAG TPA: FG-GAP-like repeat-containing protein [Kofleriaceae bacterium]|nr:FG-GAP-like repeat-containing protein [Kofleriaceae bacterium]